MTDDEFKARVIDLLSVIAASLSKQTAMDIDEKETLEAKRKAEAEKFRRVSRELFPGGAPRLPGCLS